MITQGFVVAVIITTASVYLALTLAPTRWRGRLAARLGRLARAPQTPPLTRKLATTLGRALSPSVGCAGCSGRDDWSGRSPRG